MRYLITFLVCVVLIFASSCRKDFSTIPSFGKLEFSKDTVFLDTIFTNIGSSTYNLKVYNRGNKAITIPEISLENGANSNYRLNVDGIPGKEFSNIDILAKDSIFIFVETTIDVDAITDPLYTDKILFDTGIKEQNVDLVTLVQDANFIFPDRNPITRKIDSLTLDGEATIIKGRFLTDAELTITNNKPTVFYGYAAVPANKTLTIEAGAKLFFHNNSGLIVDSGATLKVNGTLNEKVVFEGDRLENRFGKTPGQWGTIWIRPGSRNNVIKHAQIKNAIIGFLVEGFNQFSRSPTLKLENTEIYNHSNFGILGRQTSIEGNNVVIGSAGQASLAATIGGSYKFTHSTFANYWNNGIRSLPSVLVNNFTALLDENGEEITETRDLIAANFTNCIFDGNNNIEFLLDKVEGSPIFNYNINNCLIRFNDTDGSFEDNEDMVFENNPNYNDVIINGFSDFKDTTKEDFIIGQDSDAIGKAKTTGFTFDLLGIDRTTTPDIGAYQHIIFEEDETEN
jgi:hypothetical protein